MKLPVFLQLNFGAKWSEINRGLIELGEGFPEYYSRLFKNKHISDLGLDIGITKDETDSKGYRFHLFEVNTYVAGISFEVRDAITQLRYFLYLDEELRKGALAAGRKLS